MTTPDRQIEQAVARFEAFHGRAPRGNEIGAIMQDGAAAGLVVGQVAEITYKPLSEKALYRHRFAKKARPTLAVSYDGKQSYVVGGASDFTGRGYVDRTAKGTKDMVGEIVLFNPRHKAKGKRHMTRKQKKYFGGGAKKKRRRASRGLMAASNPRPFRRARAALSSRSGLGTAGGIENMILPVAIGAGAAFGIEMLWQQPFIPAAVQTGLPAGAAKVAASIALGYGVGMIAGKKYGTLVALGGATVAVFNTVLELAGGMTSGTVAAAATDAGATNALNRYVSNRRGMIARYVSARQGMGYSNPGRVARV